MGKIIKEKHTYVIDKEGHTITTDTREYGDSIPKKEAIRRGLIKVSRASMQKIFSEAELKEMGYDSEEEDLQQ